MKRQLYLLLTLVGFITINLKSMTNAETKAKHAEPDAVLYDEKTHIMIHARIWCNNYSSPIYKNISAAPTATLGALRTTIAKLIVNLEKCDDDWCPGIQRCVKASFKNAVNKAGHPEVQKDRYVSNGNLKQEVWDDKDTIEAALKRNKRNPEHMFDFRLDEPRL